MGESELIRLVRSMVVLDAPLDPARVRDRLVWVTRARSLVAESLEQDRAGPRFDFYLDLPAQRHLPVP
jgi:hypothetical protein